MVCERFVSGGVLTSRENPKKRPNEHEANLLLDVYEALNEIRLLLEGFQHAVLIFTDHTLPKQFRS